MMVNPIKWFGEKIRQQVGAAFAAVGEESAAADQTSGHLGRRVSELEHAQDEAANNARRVQAIVDAAADGIITINDKGMIDGFNKAASRIFGYGEAEVLGQNVSMLMPEHVRAEHDEYLRRANLYAVRIINQSRDLFGLRKDGTTFAMELNVSQVNVGGKKTFIGVLRDVTERINAAIRVENAQRIAKFGNWEWNIASGKIIWSDQVYRIFGHEPQSFEATFEAFLEAIHPQDRQAVRDAVNASLENHEPYKVEHRVWQPDGNQIHVLEQGEAQYTEDGAPVTMNGTVQDITDRVQADQEKQASREILERQAAELRDLAELNAVARAEAESAAQAKTDFLANMSHEIRTPMNAIIGLSHLALETELDTKQRDYVQKINESGRGLLGVINDVLDFSKVEAGKLELEKISFDLADVLRQLKTLTGFRADEKGLPFEFSLAPDLPRYLIGDPLRLGQVLLNLVGNAIKFTEAGQVKVEVGLADGAAISGKKPALHFAVRDTGIGLDETQVGKLFQAFSQADGSTTRKFGGTGLGLMISRRLVDLMEGEIVVESTPGAGSVFSFTAVFDEGGDDALLCAADIDDVPGQSSIQGDDGAFQPLSGLRVLLAEDNEINQQVASEILIKAGASVTVADNGVKAVETVGEGALSFDVVLMDLQMPDMDGYEATRRLRDTHPPEKLPILAMTAHAMAEEREKCLKAGMQDHVTKPFDPELLLSTLKNWLPDIIKSDNGHGAQARTRGALPDQPAPAVGQNYLPDTLDGIDMTEALRRLMGNREMLARLLNSFADRYRLAASEIRGFVAQHDFAKAEFLSHTVKGAAGNLAAGLLFEHAGKLEKSCADEDKNAVDDNLESFEAELTRVVEAIDTMAFTGKERQAESIPCGEMDHAAVGECMDRIAGLLKARNLNAGKVAVELIEALAGNHGTLSVRIKSCVERLDFGGAETALAALADELNGSK